LKFGRHNFRWLELPSVSKKPSEVEQTSVAVTRKQRRTVGLQSREHPFTRLIVPTLALCAVLQFAPALAASGEGTESAHVAVLELGASGEREISEQTSHVGPAIGIEVEPIEDWLEIEFGASTSRSRGATNWELDLPFKKPFRLSSNIELMPGLGPTWAHTTQAGERPSTWGAEMVLDLFIWRSKCFGWFLEPSYGISFGNGNKKSAGLTAGLFFAFP
jgi:hypothetical protein